MLPAAHRLRRSGDFATTVRRGRRVARGCVVVHLLRPAPDSQPSAPGAHEPAPGGLPAVPVPADERAAVGPDHAAGQAVGASDAHGEGAGDHQPSVASDARPRDVAVDQTSSPMPGSRATVTLDTPAGLPARADVVGEATPGVQAVADPARAGFVVSKAVGGAVVRNRVKRRLRHLMAERIDRLPSGATIVVRAQPGAALSRYQEMALDLENALDAALRLGRRQ